MDFEYDLHYLKVFKSRFNPSISQPVLFLLCCFAIIAISSPCTAHRKILNGAVACRQLEANDLLITKRRSARGYVTTEAPPTPVRHWMPRPDLPPGELVPSPPLH